MIEKMVGEGKATHLIFTYGTLKRGFWNHSLLQDLMQTGDAVFLGTYRTAEKYPLVCGPYRVPFLLNLPDYGHRVRGELYAVSTQGLIRTDELEGMSRGHYERLPIKVVMDNEKDGGDSEAAAAAVEAEAYYAHRSFAMEMWSKEGKEDGKVISSYSDEEAIGYVKRVDRPQNVTFLEQIRLFLSSSSN